MGTILFNAFSFLRKKLTERGVPCTNVRISIEDGQRAGDILAGLGIGKDDIEGVFVNGRIVPLDTPLNDGDRVAALPPGTPGPYRLLLGLVKRPGSTGERGTE